LIAILVALGVVITFGYGQWDVATESIKFDLQRIGESIYQAHGRSGKWPAQVSDLEGTVYLNMPYRRKVLDDDELFQIIWHQDLDPKPAVNHDRILAYDKGSLMAALGSIWACRGDLAVERISSEQAAALGAEPRWVWSK
jgi:hypothetical protein